MLKKYFSLKNYLADEEIEGEIPHEKEIYKSYWKVAYPASLEGIFINLILLADLFMVGRLGIAYAAAIGIVSQPKMVIQMLGKSLGVGVTATIARRKGQNDTIGMNDCIKQSFIITILLSLLISFFAIKFRRNILSLMGANQEYLSLAMDYFHLLVYALFFKALSAILTSINIGLGKTNVNLRASVIGNLVNVVFNYALIFGRFGLPRLEIKGAAIATILGEFTIFCILLVSLFLDHKAEGIDLKEQGTFKFKRKAILPVLEIGGNSFVEQICQRVGLIIFARLIAQLGTVAVGTHHYCALIWDLYYYFGIGLGTASAAYAGINLGKKRKDLARLYTLAAQKIGLVISVFVSLLFILGRKYIFLLLLKDQDLIYLGSNIMLIVALILIPQTQGQILSGTLRGAGDNRFIAIYSLFISAILRSAVAYVFAFIFNLGLYGIWIGFLVDELLIMAFTEYRIKKGYWLAKEV